MKNTLISICLFLLVGNFNSFAATIKVNSIPELKAAIQVAKKGDIIILADNTYSNAGTINISTSNITVAAATAGGVIFNGNSKCTITGNNTTFSGFQFVNGSIGDNEAVIEIKGNYNIITQCNFSNIVSKNYIHFLEGSHHNELTYCNIEEKPATMNAGPGIQITTSATVVNHTKISHCTFLNFDGDGGDFGNEPIRIGLGIEQNNTSAAVVEYCYFENLGKGDSETISIKSTSNVIRYNTFNKNQQAQLVLRTGNKTSAYGNFFINSGGIRVKEGGNHMIYNNYFEGVGNSGYSAIQLMNFKLNKKTLVGEPLDIIYIYNNTFYNSAEVDLGGEGENPPKNVKIANNIFYKTSGSAFTNDNPNVTFTNNIFFGGSEIGVSVSKNSFTKIDPKLALNTSGFYGLTPSSPAIDKSNTTNPAILANTNEDNDANLMLDIQGQARDADKSKKDIGCDEYSNGTISNHPLKKTEVGPSYLSSVSSEPKSFSMTKTKIIEDPLLKEKTTFENEYFKVSKNIVSENSEKFGTRVLVGLSNVKIKSPGKNEKIARGEVAVYKTNEVYKINGGEFFEIVVKKEHPKLTTLEKWLEPENATVLYEDDQFRVFAERLAPGATRPLHTHAQRIAVRLNDAKLTDPRFEISTLPGAGIQIANTAKFAEAMTHVVKNIGTTDLNNVIIEFKTAH